MISIPKEMINVHSQFIFVDAILSCMNFCMDPHIQFPPDCFVDAQLGFVVVDAYSRSIWYWLALWWWSCLLLCRYVMAGTCKKSLGQWLVVVEARGYEGFSGGGCVCAIKHSLIALWSMPIRLTF